MRLQATGIQMQINLRPASTKAMPSGHGPEDQLSEKSAEGLQGNAQSDDCADARDQASNTRDNRLDLLDQCQVCVRRTHV